MLNMRLFGSIKCKSRILQRPGFEGLSRPKDWRRVWNTLGHMTNLDSRRETWPIVCKTGSPCFAPYISGRKGGLVTSPFAAMTSSGLTRRRKAIAGGDVEERFVVE